MEETISRASLMLIAGVSAASFATLSFLFLRHISGTPLVAYEPRRRVPWGPEIALAAMVFPFAGVAITLIGVEPAAVEESVVEEQTPELIEGETPPEVSEPSKFVANGLATSLLMIVFVAVVALFLRSSNLAELHDLGWPANREQLIQDIGLGAFACIASIFPTFALQSMLTLLLQPKAEHPMIEEFQVTHTPAMFLVGLLMVVIAAPLFEEFTFRLLLQGWLEKWEDQSIGYSGTERPLPLSSANLLAEEVESDPDPVEDELAAYSKSDPPPRTGVLPDLPHGWLPILISSTLFGLAHFGHGVSPIPLVVFGMVLGYLYQRTHRLAPSITAHGLFNAYSMMLLWLNL